MSYTQILYPRLRELLDEGAQLIEVLPAENYAAGHLPGAINIPLKNLDARSSAVLDRSRPVVVYCWDGLWDLSARAACRLASLGFEQVCDYSPGKVDWMARAVPLDEDRARERRAIDFSKPGAVTCGLRDAVGPLRSRVADSPYGFALVLGDDGVLLGRLRKAGLAGDPEALAEEVMEPGPSTNRPDASLAKLLAKLQERELTTAILTDPEGRLLGVVRRADLEAAG